MNDGSLSGKMIVPASSSIQINTSAAAPQVMYFYWVGPEYMYGYSTEIYSGDSCIIDPAVTPTPTDDPGDPSPTPTPMILVILPQLQLRLPRMIREICSHVYP
jgi:hypothetical protein